MSDVLTSLCVRYGNPTSKSDFITSITTFEGQFDAFAWSFFTDILIARQDQFVHENALDPEAVARTRMAYLTAAGWGSVTETGPLQERV